MTTPKTIINPNSKNCQDTAGTSPACVFDAGDIDHLCRRAVFPEWPSTDKMRNVRSALEWLRDEDHAAELHFMIAEIDGDYSTMSYYYDYRKALDLAADVLKFVFYRKTPQGRPGSYQPIDVEAIKARIDIVDYVSRDVTLKKLGKLFWGLCPFHSEKHASFAVDQQKQLWYCHGACHTGGDIIDFVKKRENCDFKTAIGILQGS